MSKKRGPPFARFCAGVLAATTALLLSPAAPVSAISDISVSLTGGWDIFTAEQTGSGSYRYGPSVIINADKSVDAWFASPGDGNGWDRIRYRHSTDDGRTWTPDVPVLQGTTGARDANTAGDPGVIKAGGYYYIGYTSTSSADQTDNEIFIARSENPDGPFEKWNGTGWGGNPQPFIRFSEATGEWGAGEPSFVLKDGVIYIYYTVRTIDGSPDGRNDTRLMTAPASDPDWPGRLTYKGIVFDKQGSDDSADIKYIDEYEKFIAFYTTSRMTENSSVLAFESDDGFVFILSNLILNGALKPYLHNMGVSGRENGHINLSDNNFIAYAYGTRHAHWNTYLNPIKFSFDSSVTSRRPGTPEDETSHGPGSTSGADKAPESQKPYYPASAAVSAANPSSQVTSSAGEESGAQTGQDEASLPESAQSAAEDSAAEPPAEPPAKPPAKPPSVEYIIGGVTAAVILFFAVAAFFWKRRKD
ncbi:MAG: hypothetical protein LBQ48_03955 [Oscillospiraceae bacterium]|jgi:hypothetical protein|nr:hypothetical protein [Oscillospiraceae bacterium]